jgi:hypothetical protein
VGNLIAIGTRHLADELLDDPAAVTDEIDRNDEDQDRIEQQGARLQTDAERIVEQGSYLGVY